MKKLCYLFLLLFFSNLTFANWYIGISGGQSDYSDFTIEDLELSALNITKNDDKDFAFNLYLGKELNDYFNYEIGYLNIGKRLVDGNVSGATLSSEQKMEGISTSMLLKKEIFDGFTPYFRFGLTAGITDIKTNKGGNAQSVFQNPNNEKASIFGISPIYGIGLDFNVSDNLKIRADYMRIHDGLNDYINNIDNGYPEEDLDLITAGIQYNFGTEQSKPFLDNSYSIGFFVGKSELKDNLTSGYYNGPTWNLQTNTIRATVTGNFYDDNKDDFYKFSIYKKINNYQLEAYISSLGIFKSKSSTRGVTGSGNALTGAATRETTLVGISLGYKFNILDYINFVPKIGGAFSHTRDEIYNNLDFTGFNGSKRGPIVKHDEFIWTAGIDATYEFENEGITVALSYDYFNDIGDNSSLGESDVETVSVGLIKSF